MLCFDYIFGVIAKNNFLLILGVLVVLTTTGCANNNMAENIVPGKPSTSNYGITFDIDWDVYDSGTYSYGPEGSYIRRMGGGRHGYELFFDLTLDFAFKDGREYHEKIDLRPLVKKMEAENEIPDLSKTRWGGMIDLTIDVQDGKLSLIYVVYERRKSDVTQKELFPKRYYFPIFEKKLD